MKKMLALALSAMFIMLNLPFQTAVFADTQIRITVDGNEIYTDQPPIIKNDRVFVPVRVIAESLGADVDFDNSEGYGKVYIKDAAHTSEFIIDYPFCLIDALTLAIDTAPFIENSRTLLPVRIVSEALGCLVLWDGDAKTVSIKKSVYDESKYDNLKIYSDKPLVYEAIYEEEPYYFSPHHMSYCTYSVPAINIGTVGAKAISEEIDKLCKKYRGGEKATLYGLHFSYYLYDGILSVVLCSDLDSGDRYDVFCFEVESGKMLKNEDLFDRFGIDREKILNAVKNKYLLNLEVNKKQNNKAPSGINSIFIDNNGYIRAIVNSYEEEGEFTIDSEIHI